MKKQAVLVLLSLTLVSAAAYADPALSLESKPEEKSSSAPHGRRLFVVETDSESASESLNRIAGEIDNGFLQPESEFESEDHYRSGPFAMQEKNEYPES